MRKIDITKKVQKFITALPLKHRKQVVHNILGLQNEVKPQDSKKLTHSDCYRVDSGEYRIVYMWDKAVVYIKIIGKRNDSTGI